MQNLEKIGNSNSIELIISITSDTLPDECIPKTKTVKRLTTA